jgi:hypothetical protein
MPLADVNGTRLNYCWDGPGQGTVVMFSNFGFGHLHVGLAGSPTGRGGIPGTPI